MDVASPEHAFIFQPRRMTQLKKLTLAFAFLITAAAAAHAQIPSSNPGTDPLRNARIERDAARREEILISDANRRNASMEREADAARRAAPRTFKAVVEVTNHAAKAIRSVEWTTTLTDPDTGAVIHTYDVTTRADIAPGKTKRLSKNLRTPHARVASATDRNAYQPKVGNIKVAVKGVTYADGTTSTTP